MVPAEIPRSVPRAGRYTRLMSTAARTTQLTRSARTRPRRLSRSRTEPAFSPLECRTGAWAGRSAQTATRSAPSPMAHVKMVWTSGIAFAPPNTMIRPGPIACPAEAANV